MADASLSPTAFLRKGGTIGVMAPCSIVERADIEASKAKLEELGYNVFVHPQTYERENQSAGTVLQKSMALQGLWMREDIDVIWAAGGGNRGATLLESINFEKTKDKAKPLIGFSDVTPLLNGIYAHTGTNCFHAPVFKQLHKHQNLPDILALLEGGVAEMDMSRARVVQEGEATGPVFGGCLSPFLLLPGTQDCPDLEGAILFLEDCNEEISRIDRMLLHLRRLGVLHKIGGLVFGQFRNLQDSGTPFGYSLEDCIKMHTDGCDIPIVMDAPFGHGEALQPLRVGEEMSLSAQGETAVFKSA